MSSKPLVVVLALVVAVSLFAGPALAAGPHDGAYAVTQTGAGGFVLSYFIVVIESGESFAFASLFTNGAWTYGIGEKVSPNSGEGTLYQVDGDEYGSFAVSVLPEGVLNGTVVVGGVTYQIIGVRFF